MTANDDGVPDVEQWLQALARTPLDAPPLADPSVLWWKAQLAKQLEAERRVQHVLEMGERWQVTLGALGVLALSSLAWSVLAPISHPTWIATLLIVGGVCPAAIGAAMQWTGMRRRPTDADLTM